MELKRVLIIEDRDETGEKVKELFASHDVAVTHIRDDEEIESKLRNSSEYQLIILDWLLDGESSELAKVCLYKIRQACFLPVVVWTEEIETFNGDREDVIQIFPQVCIQAFSKSEVQLDDLLDVLLRWHSTPPMSLARGFRKSVLNAFVSSFYDLASQSSDDLVRGLKSLISTSEGQYDIDIEHPIDVLLRMIARSIYHDDEFISQLRKIIGDLQLKKPPQTEKDKKKERKIRSQIMDFYMYYEPRSDDSVIRTGDIVNVRLEGLEQVLKAIVITPACDLVIPKKTNFLRLILIHKATYPDEDKKDDKWPMWEHSELHVVSFHEVLVLRDDTKSAEQSPQSVMSYSHQFSNFSGINAKMERIKRLDNPYQADLLHSFVSHAGRIGVPEFRAPPD